MTSVPPDFEYAQPRAGHRSVVSGNLLAFGSMVLLAAGFPAAEVLLATWHPLALMMLRLAMALAVLIPLWILIDGVAAVLRARWLRAFWIGFIGFGAGTNLLLFAQWYTDPVTVALIATTTPIAATMVEWLGKRRRVTPRFIIGLCATVAGGAIAVAQSVSLDFGMGLAMAVLAGLSFAWASDRAVQDLPALSALGRSAITFVGAAVFTGVIFAVGAATQNVSFPHSITAQEFAMLVVYAVAAMALSQILFIASVSKIGIALSSFHMNIAPFYVMIILVSLGGVWDGRAALGALIVGVGVLVAQDAGPGKRLSPRGR